MSNPDLDSITSTTSPPPSLTTIFTPPPSCTNIVTYDGYYFWQGRLFDNGDMNCYPALYSAARNKFYSPGVCPGGWFSAGSASGAGALVSISTESNALCCPTGYQTVRPPLGPTSVGNTIFCGSVIDALLTNVYSTSTLETGFLPVDYTQHTTAIDPATLPTYVQPTVWAEMIQVRWQSTDTNILALQSELATEVISTSSGSPTSSTSSTSSSSKTSSTTSTESTPTASLKSTGDGLSTGTKAGIGIGAAALVGLIIFGALLLQRKKKHPESQHSDVPLVPPRYEDPKQFVKEDSREEYPEELNGQYNQTGHPYHPRQRAELVG